MKISENNQGVVPFWSWNDKLDARELKNQIDEMKKVGINGFFMHARGGLETEYMGEDWFNLIEVCMDYAESLGMDAWAYDENGWPSGFADGKVPAAGEEFQQKWLVYSTLEDPEILPKNLIAFYTVSEGEIKRTATPKKGDIAISYGINKYYIDAFNKDCIAYFLKTTHEKYAEKLGEKLGSSLKGFFTDENQYAGNSVPWSHLFPKLFKERYGYDIIDCLPLLFINNENSYPVRNDFYVFVADLFKESFLKQINDWCNSHNCLLTGHVMGEQSLSAQVAFTGGAMSCYEYFGLPGVDWLGRRMSNTLIPKQLGSAAKQLGKKTVTETFAMCGWDVSLNELKGIAQSQYVHGVTSICPHLEGYSIRGYRKRDYPASLFVQSPWFKPAYKEFCDYFRKLGNILDSGVEIAPLLVIHPMQTVYILRNTLDERPMRSYDEKFIDFSERLSKEHILHHYGDETLISKKGEVKNRTFKVGECEYNSVLLPSLLTVSSSTADLLLEFSENGGKIYYYGDFPELIDGRKDPRCGKLKELAEGISDIGKLKHAEILTDKKENPNIYFTCRVMKSGEKIYYLVNLANEVQRVQFNPGGTNLGVWDIQTDTLLPAIKKSGYYDLTFGQYGSYILRTMPEVAEKDGFEEENLKLNNLFQVKECSPNALTLDFCQYKIEGGEWQPKTAVISLQNKLLELKRPVDFDLKFTFTVKEKSAIKGLKLCAETPEKYRFKINGRDFDFKSNGHFTDKSIHTADISDYCTVGENEIIMSGNFYQRDKVYSVLFEPNVHESERNKLTFDTELESLYIIGDFSVEMAEDYTYGDRRCIFGGETFALNLPKTVLDITKITESGYWFFSGEIKLCQKVNLTPERFKKYFVELSKLNAPAGKLEINGKFVGNFTFAPFKLDVTDFVADGENEVEITLYSGNRNLLGPHHKPYGESYAVGPATFTDKASWPEDPTKPLWTDRYSFVLFGAEIE